MWNAYCDADENPLDLRVHRRQYTTWASVRGKRVTITSTLYWHSHIYTITAEANKLLRLLKRTFLYLTDTSTRRTLYLSPVKSQLCHATQVWSPAQVSLKAQVERVQRHYQMDLTKPDWRDVLQTHYPGLTPSYLWQRTEKFGIP